MSHTPKHGLRYNAHLHVYAYRRICKPNRLICIVLCSQRLFPDFRTRSARASFAPVAWQLSVFLHHRIADFPAFRRSEELGELCAHSLRKTRVYSRLLRHDRFRRRLIIDDNSLHWKVTVLIDRKIVYRRQFLPSGSSSDPGLSSERSRLSFNSISLQSIADVIVCA